MSTWVTSLKENPGSHWPDRRHQHVFWEDGLGIDSSKLVTVATDIHFPYFSSDLRKAYRNSDVSEILIQSRQDGSEGQGA